MQPNDTRLAEWLEAAWMARYLERALTEEEAVWFEAYVLDKPRLIEAIERDSDLRDLVYSARLDSAVAHAGRDAPRAVPRPRRTVPLALAASLVASVIGVLLGRNLAGDSPLAVDADPLVVHVEAMRSAGDSARIDGGSAASRLALLEIVVPAGTTRLEARIGESVVDRSVDASETLVTLALPIEALDSGTLELRLYREGSSSEREIALPKLPKQELLP